MSPTNLPTALLALALSMLTGCGHDGATPTEAGEATAESHECACPNDSEQAWRMRGLLTNEPVRIGQHSYHVHGDTGIVNFSPNEFSSGLDLATAFCGAVQHDRSYLYVAGCRNGAPFIRVFASETEKGRVNSYVGEYELPSTIRIVAMTDDAIYGKDRAEGISATIYAYDELGNQMLKIIDEDHNGIPNKHVVYARFKERPCWYMPAMWRHRDGNFYVSEGGCVQSADDIVLAVIDTNDDGKPEYAGDWSTPSIHYGGPWCDAPPRVVDTSLMVDTLKNTTIEIWLTDDKGNKQGHDASVYCIGRAAVGEAKTIRVPLRRPLRVGQHVTAYDVKRYATSRAMRVYPNYPVVESVQGGPKVLRGGEELRLTGSSLDLATTVQVVSHRGSLPLEVLEVSPTELRVEVPELDSTWRTGLSLEVTSKDTPARMRHPRFEHELVPVLEPQKR